MEGSTSPSKDGICLVGISFRITSYAGPTILSFCLRTYSMFTEVSKELLVLLIRPYTIITGNSETGRTARGLQMNDLGT